MGQSVDVTFEWIGGRDESLSPRGLRELDGEIEGSGSRAVVEGLGAVGVATAQLGLAVPEGGQVK